MKMFCSDVSSFLLGHSSVEIDFAALIQEFDCSVSALNSWEEMQKEIILEFDESVFGEVSFCDDDGVTFSGLDEAVSICHKEMRQLEDSLDGSAFVATKEKSVFEQGACDPDELTSLHDVIEAIKAENLVLREQTTDLSSVMALFDRMTAGRHTLRNDVFGDVKYTSDGHPRGLVVLMGILRHFIENGLADRFMELLREFIDDHMDGGWISPNAGFYCLHILISLQAVIEHRLTSLADEHREQLAILEEQLSPLVLIAHTRFTEIMQKTVEPFVEYVLFVYNQEKAILPLKAQLMYCLHSLIRGCVSPSLQREFVRVFFLALDNAIMKQIVRGDERALEASFGFEVAVKMNLMLDWVGKRRETAPLVTRAQLMPQSVETINLLVISKRDLTVDMIISEICPHVKVSDLAMVLSRCEGIDRDRDGVSVDLMRDMQKRARQQTESDRRHGSKERLWDPPSVGDVASLLDEEPWEGVIPSHVIAMSPVPRHLMPQSKT
eukprot:TRINITY_DN24550_c0_g1_i1.p1 TRINITY_DN24550_c0_g1~~TRINITY_DN24550_c0_g1_i1.p1  ORF type:complete len:495 (+),score=153.36 TRINITY_DN24550_c0_g1_i1:950-2434(+)